MEKVGVVRASNPSRRRPIVADRPSDLSARRLVRQFPDEGPSQRGQQEAAAVLPGWWGDSTVEVKYVAVVSTPGDLRSAHAVEPDGRPLDAGVQLATAAGLGEEGVQLGQQGHGLKA
jgi:hypothetical protein